MKKLIQPPQETAGVLFLDGLGNYIGSLVGLEGHIRTIGEGYAVLLTAVLVIVGWYLSERFSKSSHRRQNAHRYIIDHNDDLKKLVVAISDNLKSRTPFPAYNITDDAKSLALKSLLTKMEIIAVDIRYGLVSEKYIRDAQCSLIISIFELSKIFISTTRNNRKHFTAYQNFECLYIRLKYRKNSASQRIIEFLFNRPMFSITMAIFKIKYSSYCILNNCPKSYLEANDDDISKAVNMFDRISYGAYGIAITALFIRYLRP